MIRIAFLSSSLVVAVQSVAVGQDVKSGWHMVYTRSHRATFEQEWKYTFPNHRSKRWIIALRYPPELPWSREAVGKAELHTSAGWIPFRKVIDESPSAAIF